MGHVINYPDRKRRIRIGKMRDLLLDIIVIDREVFFCEPGDETPAIIGNRDRQANQVGSNENPLVASITLLAPMGIIELTVLGNSSLALERTILESCGLRRQKRPRRHQ
jgi:hypothetical protein